MNNVIDKSRINL